MEDPTQTRVYWGTPEQQREAYAADAAEAAQHGWQPRSFEQTPGPMQVTFVRLEDRAPIGLIDDVVPPAPRPDSEAPASEPLATRRPHRLGPWEPLAYGTLLGAMILAVWGALAYWSVPQGPGVGPTPSQPYVAHCSPASLSLVDAIGTGLTVPAGGGLRDVFTVASRDHPGTLFVAALIEGIGTNAPVGLWATDDPTGHGSIYSVNGKAMAFSVWPDGGAIESHLSELDDGADVAVACADG